jgi:hypothetical protein
MWTQDPAHALKEQGVAIQYQHGELHAEIFPLK